tara:strand:- start:87 stop:308 length:222 start_codon:yes stop_codon:yes gene_type:complete
MKQPKFDIDLNTKVKKKGNGFVAWCPAIGISSQGETKEKALKNLDEAVKQFVKVCYEKGIFDKLIKKNQSLIN